jgi:hypothetical protein
MNFQAVSVGQKLVVKSISITGGYTDALRNAQRGSAEGNIPVGFPRRTRREKQAAANRPL